MTDVLTRRGENKRHNEEGHVKMEAEIAVMLSQAKDGLEPPKAGRGKEGLFPRDLLTP